MNLQIVRDALPELQRQLEEIHEARRQIESTSRTNTTWDSQEAAIPYLLNCLYERLLVLLEVAGLPKASNALPRNGPGSKGQEVSTKLRLALNKITSTASH